MRTMAIPSQGFRIPTIVGILLVIGIVGSLIALVEWYGRKPGIAGGSVVPAMVTVTNVTDAGFTVVWTTPHPATGAITIVSPRHTPSTFFDDRDTTGTMRRYTTHSVTLRSLLPATTYRFRILSDGKPFDQAGKPYSATTASPLPAGGSGLEPAYGMIEDSAGSRVAGALVLVSVEQGQLLSTLTSPSGSWLLSLALTRNASLTKYLDGGSGRLTETIRVLWGNLEATAITDTLNDAPVPTIQMGKTYDFRKQQADAAAPPSVLGDTTATKPSTAATIGLTAPAHNASLATTLPLIQGRGIPGKTVSIVLGITNPTSGIATVGADGIWRYTPPKPLGAGKQSVTATTVDERGKPVAFTHAFTILKSGTQVLGEATPSATLSPTPTATPSASPSATPSPTPQLEGEPIPQSGTSLPTLLLLLVGFSLLTSGFMVSWK